MTREEAIYTLEQMKTWSKDLSDDEIEALVIALKALDQEPKTECIEYGTDGNAYKLTISNGKELEQEEKVIKMRNATPEEKESIDKYIKSISKPTGVSFGNLEQEPESCNTCKYSNEIDGNNCYECVKDMKNNYSLKKIEPCEDCISRKAVLDGIEELKKSPWATDKRGLGFEYLITEALDVVAELCIKQEPPVNPKSDVLDKIRAEIEQIEINGYIRDAECFIAGIRHALTVIDKYKNEMLK